MFVTLIRLTLFGWIAVLSPKAALLYLVAYMLMLNALRYADAFQHTYSVFSPDDPNKLNDGVRRDRAYEDANTYSNLISRRYLWLNLLLLHFPFHNAHHRKPGVPWYRLPALHQKLFGDPNQMPVIPFGVLIRSFFKYRVHRLLSEDYGAAVTSQQPVGFYGAVGVSFLTAI